MRNVAGVAQTEAQKSSDLFLRTAGLIGAIILFATLASEVAKAWSNMSTLEKVISVLGLLAIAAVGAAIAVGALQSAWSLGIAAAAIVAGIIAITAAVNSATKRASSAGNISGNIGAASTGASSRTFGLSELPQLARGGIVDGATAAILGEKGREAVVPLDRDTRALDEIADRVAARMGGGGNSELIELMHDLIDAVKARQTIEVDRRVFGRVVHDVYDAEDNRQGVRIQPRGAFA